MNRGDLHRLVLLINETGTKIRDAITSAGEATNKAIAENTEAYKGAQEPNRAGSSEPVSVEIDLSPEEAKRYYTEQDKTYKLQRRTFWVNLAAFVGIAIYAGITYATLCEIRKQTKSAHDALHISQRAYITSESPRLDITNGLSDIQFNNVGHIPSGQVEVIIHEATVIHPTPNQVPNFHFTKEKHWKKQRWPSAAPGPAFSYTVSARAFSKELIISGYQAIIISGTAIYNDGFPDDPQQTWKFCLHTSYHSVKQQIFWTSCDPELVIPQMEALDGYPKNEEKNQ